MERAKVFFSEMSRSTFWSSFAWKVLALAFVFLNLWTFFDAEALPPGPYFHLFSIFISSLVCAKLSYLLNLPPLFGSLIGGFAYSNLTEMDVNRRHTSTIRSFALMVILLRAGLSLDLNVLKRLSAIVGLLAFTPCLVEAAAVAVFTSFFFNSLPPSWALLTGFTLAAVSPAVVVPQMLQLQSKKLGVRKGIPTLITAASSIDDVLAISGFSVCLSFAFSHSKSGSPSNDTWKLIMSLLKAPSEAAVGIIYGLLGGALLWYIPEMCSKPKSTENSSETSSKYNFHRLVLLLLFGSFSIFGSQKLDIGGAGPLAVMMLSFVAAIRWRPAGFDVSCESSLKTLWSILYHYLFCLIGGEIRIKNLQTSVLLYATLVILFSLIFRLAAAFLLTYGSSFSAKERLFIAIAWLPKATVQAALGPVALDMATDKEDIERGHLVLTFSVIAILMTAPIGAVLIDLSSRILLSTDEVEVETAADDDDEAGHRLNGISSDDSPS